LLIRAMPAVDQKERYRHQAALCYDIAARMAPAQATSIIRLGDSYAALACGERLVWKSASLSSRLAQALPTSPSSREGDRRITQYIAVSFRRAWNDFIPGPAIECPDATLAIQRAELMTREEHIAGAVAFSRRGDPVSVEVETAVILESFGNIPEDFDIA
jgi:hypothetical protein